MVISLVVPCYNEEAAIPYFYREIVKLAETMQNQEFEFIFIDDGSRDKTLLLIRNLTLEDVRVHYISFSRNFGKEAAIYAGLEHARGDYAVLMDADLQDPPAMLPQMLAAVTEEGYDSVATRRVTRQGEPPVRSFFARIFYKIMNKISQIDLVDGARDYRLMNRKFINALLSMREYNRFSKGLFGWIGFKTKWIEFENVERIAGETKWSFWKLLIYAVEGIVAFSTAPLVVSTIIGVFCCLLSFMGVLFIIFRKLLFEDPIQGWASTVCLLLGMGGIQLFCTGILGQYLAKTYLETKKRPVYVIDSTDMERNIYDGQNI